VVDGVFRKEMRANMEEIRSKEIIAEIVMPDELSFSVRVN